MSTAAPTPKPPPPPPREYTPLAGLLSYLVPGLGQIAQGRIGKGLLFLGCVYALFFYGQYLGSGTVTRVADGRVETYRVASNVYLPDTAAANNPFNLPQLAANLYNRPQFAGQFWVGIAAWPAVWQYWRGDDRADDRGGRSLLGDYQKTPADEALNAVHTAGDKSLELGWVYTVIAGVLNIMVIYDAIAGPAFLAGATGPVRRAA